MKLKNILEELKKSENKDKFRKMAKEFHPDKGGDINLMKELNTAKETDETFEEFYNKVKGKTKKSKSEVKQAWSRFFKDENDRNEWHSRVNKARSKKQVKLKKSKNRNKNIDIKKMKNFFEDLNESSKSIYKTFKKNKMPLTPEERKEVISKKAVWHRGPHGEETSAVWKSKDGKGEIFYITNTHRAWQKKPTLKGAINIFHSFIKGTA